MVAEDTVELWQQLTIASGHFAALVPCNRVQKIPSRYTVRCMMQKLCTGSQLRLDDVGRWTGV
ncbi:hypothetical protein ZHAS_00015959 [Anopheles sinensis]|uniref:Uncharacterized protein n=1 Tax=Anopheles sinensis TaxID=74873 RepID=A0A084WCF7_ANOSI|nr:hypothetical protein ZHAS_00015959 [Anopheles sinensis]